MKKQIFYAALAAAAVLTACNKTPEPVPASEGNKVTICAVLPQTKVAASAAETGLSWSWEAGDKLTVIGTTTEVFDIKSGFTAREAEFDGTAVNSGPYTILYPGTLTSMTDAEKYDWTKQKQVGNDSPAHLQYLAALEGVDQYEEFSFDAEWAAAHGGTLKQSGVVKFVLTLPEAITGVKKVEAVIPAASVSVGLELEDVTLAEGNVLTAYAGFPWTSLTVPVALETTVMVTTDTDVVWNKTITLPAGASIQSGKVNNVVLNVNGWECTERYAGGTGVEGDPWLIDNALHMVHMNEDLTSGETKYFKLISDIDMSSVTSWEPANAPSPFDKCIDFNGNNHTISNFTCTSASYPSLFGVLYGKAYDFTMTNATVTAGAASACGIVGGYCGTSNIAAEATNIHVQGSVTCSFKLRGIGGMFGRVNGGVVKDCSAEVTVTNTGGDTGVGGMFGWIAGTTIERCYANCTVSSNANYAGGLFGFDNGTVTVKDCYTAGSVSGSQRVGGIAGGLIKASSAIKNCYSTASVTATAVVGGIVSHASLDKWSAAESTPANVIEKCIAWNSSIKATASPSETYPGRGSSGVVVGYTSKNNYLTDCYRKADIEFQDNWLGNVPFDQANASPTVPLVTDTDGKQYNFPYHGKAAAATATVSSVAQSLGWSTDVWDFSSALPTLK